MLYAYSKIQITYSVNTYITSTITGEGYEAETLLLHHFRRGHLKDSSARNSTSYDKAAWYCIYVSMCYLLGVSIYYIHNTCTKLRSSATRTPDWDCQGNGLMPCRLSNQYYLFNTSFMTEMQAAESINDVKIP